MTQDSKGNNRSIYSYIGIGVAGILMLTSPTDTLSPE